jgi:hypothetical protein
LFLPIESSLIKPFAFLKPDIRAATVITRPTEQAANRKYDVANSVCGSFNPRVLESILSLSFLNSFLMLKSAVSCAGTSASSS